MKTYAKKGEISFFQDPHHLSVLIVTLLGFAAYALTHNEASYGPKSDSFIGIGATVLIVVVLAVGIMKPTLFVRPHSAFWKATQGVTFLYICVLTYLFFLKADDARNALAWFWDDMGEPLPDHDYATNCAIYQEDHPYWSPIVDVIIDPFFFAHLFGWFAKALMIRDPMILFTVSVSWEILELILNNLLINFRECWWDHIIIDVLLCNTGGILAGIWVNRYLEMKSYNFVAFKDTKGKTQKVKRALQQFSPETYDHSAWGFLESPMRYCQVIFLLFFAHMIDMNAFFLKFILWIPIPNPMNTARLFLWGAIAAPAIREYHLYINDPSSTKHLGKTALLAVAAGFLEMLICIKFFPHTKFPESPFETWQLVLASLLLAAIVLPFVFLFVFPGRRNRKSYDVEVTPELPTKPKHAAIKALKKPKDDDEESVVDPEESSVVAPFTPRRMATRSVTGTPARVTRRSAATAPKL